MLSTKDRQPGTRRFKLEQQNLDDHEREDTGFDTNDKVLDQAPSDLETPNINSSNSQEQSRRKRTKRDISVIANASELIERVQTENRGRILVAKASNIPRGTLIFEVPAHATICDSDNRRKRCGFCLGPLNKTGYDDEDDDYEKGGEVKEGEPRRWRPWKKREKGMEIVKDECHGCGEIWYCDPNHDDDDDDEDEHDVDEGACESVLSDLKDITRAVNTTQSGKNKTKARKSCRDQDWGTIHRYECGFLKRLFRPFILANSVALDDDAAQASSSTVNDTKSIQKFLKLDPYDQDYCRLLIRVLVHRFNELEDDNSQNNNKGSVNRNDQFEADACQGPDPFESIMELVENRSFFTDERLYGPMMDVARILDAFQDHLETFRDDKDQQQQEQHQQNSCNGSSSLASHPSRRRRFKHRLTLDELLSLICKEECNSFGLYSYAAWKPSQPLTQQAFEKYHAEKDKFPPFLHERGSTQGDATQEEKEEIGEGEEDGIFFNPAEAKLQKQRQLEEEPNPKICYGLGYFIRYSSPMFNHSCTPNIYHVSTNRDRMLFYAARDIHQGEELNITYLELGPDYRLYKDDLLDLSELEGVSAYTDKALAKRRKILKEHFHFDCGCARCRLELELQSQLKGLKFSQEKHEEENDCGNNKEGDSHVIEKGQEESANVTQKRRKEEVLEEQTEIKDVNQAFKTTAFENGTKEPAHTLTEPSSPSASVVAEVRDDQDVDEHEDVDDEAMVFLREGLMCQRQSFDSKQGRLVGGHTEGVCYGFYAPPHVLARMKVPHAQEYKYKYEGQRDKWACVACGHQQQKRH
ncbi:hypothetical protein BGZ83_008960 [Gryganskiella cystojenkinii]|nr:hypothetical protein BGZ83_008960 [Gryganskiella cystojenkinii]